MFDEVLVRIFYDFQDLLGVMEAAWILVRRYVPRNECSSRTPVLVKPLLTLDYPLREFAEHTTQRPDIDRLANVARRPV
jgi:hypothetical protein